MGRLRFCTDSINILLQHEDIEIVEIRPIASALIQDVETSLETAVCKILENLDEQFLVSVLAVFVLTPCRRLLQQVGFHGPLTESLGLNAMLTLVRKTVLLLDSALVSYVRSHSWDSGSGMEYYDFDMMSVGLSHGDDPLGYRYSKTRLACLNAFLDGRRVRVFQVFNKHSISGPKPQKLDTISKSVLARMGDLADIWGPVYTVPSDSGLIKYYGVSKGVICRVDVKNECSIPGAVECHYFTRSSFFMRKASKLLFGAKDLLLAADDLLLIGVGLRENHYCKYGISEFSQDWASEIGVLGTHESVWKTDTRSLALGISRYLGVTVSGSQKLIPETTRKQHILDKWTTVPTRANPGIMNQYLGVEISHCTGNARRISLRDLMTRAPIQAILERQIPGWIQTPWGSNLSTALLCEAGDAIFRVWKEFVSNRPQIAELFCCVLELLDHTGWDEHGKFHAALLYNAEELAVSIPTRINDWLAALRDTHLTSAYVMINRVCLDCEVPDHRTSACHIPQALTVLQTHFGTLSTENDQEHCDRYILKPFNLHLRKDHKYPEIYLFKPITGFPRIFWSNANSRKCTELLNHIPNSTTNAVYLAASTRSFHGLNRPKSSITPQHVPDSEQRLERSKDIQVLNQSSASEMQLRQNSNGKGVRSDDELLIHRPPRPSPHADSSQREFAVSTPTSLNNEPVQIRTQLSQTQQHGIISDKDHQHSQAETPARCGTPLIVDDDSNKLIRSDLFGQEFYHYPSRNYNLTNEVVSCGLGDDNDHDKPDHDCQTSKQGNGQPVQPKRPPRRN
ncbi:MAG: hypothetical protein Q9201_003036 [Fulgogasparrea decipioides]